MTRKTRKEIDDQGRAFIEKARELECEKDPAAFDRMFSRIAPPKRRKESKPPQKRRSARSGKR